MATGLVRFTPKSNPAKILIGQPVESGLDVGVAIRNGLDVAVKVFSGPSVLSPGKETSVTETIGRLLSPLAQNEVGTIRCIGLNVSWLLSFILSCCFRREKMSLLTKYRLNSTSSMRLRSRWTCPPSQQSSCMC